MNHMAQTPSGTQLSHIHQEPGRLLAVINLMPKWILKLKLGRLFGDRFAMITHRGRKSGAHFTVIAETAEGSVDSGRVVYVVAYGTRAQWYKNLKASPAVSIEIGGKTYHAPRHEFLDQEATERAIASYWARYPRLAALLARNGVWFHPGPLVEHPFAPTSVAFYPT